MPGTNEHGQQIHTPLFEHPIATQSLARPPLSRVRVSSIDVKEAEAFNFASEDFQYKALVIKHEDGSPVTVGEFVTQAREHLNKFKRFIIAARKNYLSSDAGDGSTDAQATEQGQQKSLQELKVSFKDVKSNSWEDHLTVNLYTFTQGESGLSTEAFWKRQRYS